MAKSTALDNWKYRILNASSIELVVISYELIFEHLDNAKQCYFNHDLDGYEENIKIAQEFLMELMTNLDMSYEISLELMQLYLYVNKLILKSYSHRNADYIDDAVKILKNMSQSWEKIAKDEKDKAPLMSNTQQVYAGLTYGRGYLNESIANNVGRGFKA